MANSGETWIDQGTFNNSNTLKNGDQILFTYTLIKPEEGYAYLKSDMQTKIINSLNKSIALEMNRMGESILNPVKSVKKEIEPPKRLGRKLMIDFKEDK